VDLLQPHHKYGLTHQPLDVKDAFDTFLANNNIIINQLSTLSVTGNLDGNN
jgi:hypothetical protein